MLCGRSTLHKGIGAAKSFFRFLPEKILLRWHDGGSLRDRDIDLIRRHLPGVTIVRRREADSVIQTLID
jgi:hypothetical protein